MSGMEKDYFEVQFNNGSECRWRGTWQPDSVFAMMEAQRYACDVFSMRWNRIADQRKWKIAVISSTGERYEEPFVITLPAASASIP